MSFWAAPETRRRKDRGGGDPVGSHATGEGRRRPSSGGHRASDMAHRSRGRKGGPIGVGHDWAIAVGRPDENSIFLFIQTNF
jgi:hypothetical protein